MPCMLYILYNVNTPGCTLLANINQVLSYSTNVTIDVLLTSMLIDVSMTTTTLLGSTLVMRKVGCLFEMTRGGLLSSKDEEDM